VNSSHPHSDALQFNPISGLSSLRAFYILSLCVYVCVLVRFIPCEGRQIGRSQIRMTRLVCRLQNACLQRGGPRENLRGDHVGFIGRFIVSVESWDAKR
jgi:hypothetical protein